jgi:peptide/nickel transport system permease protein
MAEPEGANLMNGPMTVMRRRVLGPFRRPLCAASGVFLVLLVAAVIAAPLIAPYAPLTQDLHAVFAGPSPRHPLGTDSLGRDVFTRLLYGGRVSLAGIVEAVAVMLVLGVPSGLLAGYLRGPVDAVVNRVTDVLFAIPVIITLLVVLATFGQQEAAAMITYGVLGTPGMIRVVRGATIAVRQDLYVTAARVSGLGTAQIVRRHILPRVTGPITVRTFLFAGQALLTETGLSFLGLGVQDPQPAWGAMVATASTFLSRHPELLVPPGLVIALTVLALGLVGDAVRDTLQEQDEPERPWPANARRGPETSPPDAAEDETPGVLLRVRDLSVELPTASGITTVVEQVGFDIRPGETLGLVGESGCGKTMIARALLGLLPPGGHAGSGRCEFDGTDLLTLGRRAYEGVRGGQIALISQEPVASLDPNYRAGDQIAQVVRRHQRVGRKEATAQALDLLRRVRMPDPEGVARRYPHELSGGMAQRVCIAAALAGRPRLLIADEPTTALDVTVQSEILDLLRDLQRENSMAILLITHDWGLVADLCDRAVVMYAGQVVESSYTAALFRHPLHPYTDGLMRSNPHGAAAGRRLPAITGSVPPPGAWPAGCRFQPRCPLAGPECAAGPIELSRPAGGRLTRCLHHDRLATGADAP